LWSRLGRLSPCLQPGLFLDCIYAQATWWIDDPLRWEERLSVVRIHAKCVLFVLLVVNSSAIPHLGEHFTAQHITYAYTNSECIYIFTIFSNRYLYA
jgi:hypothetical protein